MNIITMNANSVDRIVSYSGDQYGVRGIHNCLLSLLEQFDSHCRQHGIVYSLAFGSLLGCVRSHGFIPWDDDVDIVMTRSEFDKLITSLKNSDTIFSNNHEIVRPSILDKIIVRGEAGINMVIDVFIADSVPQTRAKERIKYYWVLFLRFIVIGRCGRIKSFGHFVRKALSYIVSFPFSEKKIQNAYSKACAWGNNQPSDLICCYSTTRPSYGRYHAADEMNGVEYYDFEDIKMPVMNGYHPYLIIEFGENYMTPPKEEDRRPAHLQMKYKMK